ncbi:uncharacterized protein LOC141641805 [Silene latifolia]|uniref:uncharacterized protein LOC141641805 n=1 Tax=Silene latifolia TaxID=37657 RepID=UPI003D76B5F2
MLTDDQYIEDHSSDFVSPTFISAFEIPYHSNDGAYGYGIYNSLDSNNADVFGYENIGNDSDEDEHDTTREVNDNILRQSAPCPEFNKVTELDNDLLNSWRSWSGNSSFVVDGEFCIGQEFDTQHQLKNVVKLYSITRNKSFRVKEVDSSKYVVECVKKQECNCSWRLQATRMNDLPVFRIVKYNGPHSSNCAVDISSHDHPLLSSDFVSTNIQQLIRVDPAFKVLSIIELIKDKFHYTITYKRAWFAKQKAIANIFGDWENSYEELPKFMQALKESNPGNVVHWCLIPTSDPSVHIFQRVFWAFRPSIEGFNHCRPVISIDGTHLYGKYKGTLLIAMGIDANSQLFPLAFAIVESENGDSWPWFLACIRRSVTQRPNICVISDRHAGILKAMNEIGSG